MRGGTRSGAAFALALPPPARPAGGQAMGAGHTTSGHDQAQFKSYPQAERMIRPRLDTLPCGQLHSAQLVGRNA